MKVVCICNDGFPTSLEVGKSYIRIADKRAENYGLVRIVDESGSDYIYPKEYFKENGDVKSN